MTARSTLRTARFAIPATIAFVLFGYAFYMDRTAPPSSVTTHISQTEAGALCDTGIALAEKVRHESTGDYRFYPCYASERTVAAYQ